MESMAFSAHEGVGSGRRSETLELAYDDGRIQWLGDACIGPGAPEHRNHRRMPRHAEDAYVARLGKATQAAARLDPVEAGHDGVQDDDCGPKCPHLDERLVAVGGRLDRERPLGQEIDQHGHDERLVVDDEETRARPRTDWIWRPPLRGQEAL